MISKIISTVIIISVAMSTWAQKTAQFRLTDLSDNTPLIGAAYLYGDEVGTSDQDGTIAFIYIQGKEMKISYLGYGTWIMDEAAISQAISTGQSTRAMLSLDLHPITVISLRPKMSETEGHTFTYQDKIAHDGGAILVQTPVISGIRKGGSYGLDPVMRGFKYDQLNIVMNGTQCATAACPNRMDPPTSQMAPNMLERVEILKGPHALRYGGGLGGTVNFITAAPQFYNSSKIRGRLSGRYDSNGAAKKTEAMIGLGGSLYNVALFGSWATGDDFTAGNDALVQGDFSRGSFGVQSSFKIANNQTLQLSAFQNTASDIDYPSLRMDLRKDETLMLNATHDISFSDQKLQSWTTTIFSSNVDHLMDNGLKNLVPRRMNANTSAATSNMGGRTESTWKIGRSKLYIGADLKIEEAEGIRERHFLLGPNTGKTVYDNAWQHGKITKAGLFIEQNYRYNGWQVVLAARLEMNDATVLDPDLKFAQVYPDSDNSELNPSISIGGIRNFDNDISIGLWGARAQRSASISERYINRFTIGLDPYELIGNPLLSPEVNNQLDLTLEWKTRKAAINVDIFGSLLQNYISSEIDPSLTPIIPTSPGVRRFINIDNVFKTGFEITYTQQIINNLYQDIAVAYTYAQDKDRNQPLPEIAPLDLRYSIAAQMMDNKLRTKISMRYVAEQARISTEYGETSTPSFTLVDLSIDYNMTQQWNLQVGVKNAFDISYAEHLSRSTTSANRDPLYAPGRNYFASFNYRLE